MNAMNRSRIMRTLISAVVGLCTAFGCLIEARASSPPLHDYGAAPELAGIEGWLNSGPIAISELKGKVVLVDFWTFSCINCLRTVPYVTRWYDKFRDRGLVVIGVHTPEFAYEKITRNVETAIRRHGIKYPVAQDNQYATWRAFDNEYWPAVYLIDRRGHVMLKHVGEGSYEETEQAIDILLDGNDGADR